MLIRVRGMWQGLIAAAAVAFAVTAHAAPALPQAEAAHVVTQPDWLKRPDATALTRNYPKKASDAGLSGYAQIRCRIARSGLIDSCDVTTETPPGYGFGAAAVRMAREFRFHPLAVDGQPVDGGVVNIPIRFVLPPRPPTPPPFQWR